MQVGGILPGQTGETRPVGTRPIGTHIPGTRHLGMDGETVVDTMTAGETHPRRQIDPGEGK